MEVECNAENWQDVCLQLKEKKKELVNKYDDKCFYMALTTGEVPDDLIFWRCTTKTKKRVADFLNKIFSSYSLSWHLKQIDCGFLRYTRLQKRIRKGTIAYEMGVDRDWLRSFDVVELTAKEIPKIKLNCFKNHMCDHDWKKHCVTAKQFEHLKTECPKSHISEEKFYISVSAIIDIVIRENEDENNLQTSIKHVFELLEQHNKDCNKIPTN